MQSKRQIRKFIRHPADIPIRVCPYRTADEDDRQPCEYLKDVGLGGLAFCSQQAFPVGQKVSVSFPLLDASQQLHGQVVWNHRQHEGYEIGLCFEDPDDQYRVRMIEQICHIEHYRKQVRQLEGRYLSSEKAAEEWIGKYAGNFPGAKP